MSYAPRILEKFIYPIEFDFEAPQSGELQSLYPVSTHICDVIPSSRSDDDRYLSDARQTLGTASQKWSSPSRDIYSPNPPGPEKGTPRKRRWVPLFWSLPNSLILKLRLLGFQFFLIFYRQAPCQIFGVVHGLQENFALLFVPSMPYGTP